MKQGYNARLNESMGMRNRRTMKKSKGQATMMARRSESKGMEKKMGRRAYAAVRTMDRKRRGGMSCTKKGGMKRTHKRGGMSCKKGGKKRTHKRGGMSCTKGGMSCNKGGKKRMTFLQRLGF
jgi:hypothetical protein